MKYCKKCGKELKENETCTCEISVVSNENVFKKLWETIKGIIKTPVTTLEATLNEKDDKMSYITLGTTFVSFGFIFVLIIKKFIDSILGIFSNTVDANYNYPLMFFAFAVIQFAMIVGLILITWFVSNKMFKIENMNYKNSLNLVGVSIIPTMITYLITLVLVLLFGKSVLSQGFLIAIIILISIGNLAFYTLYVMGIKYLCNCDNDTLIKISFISIVITSILVIIVSASVSTKMINKDNLVSIPSSPFENINLY